MSGIGATLNIAKGAIAAQQYGINVTGNNIANVNNSSYTRQVLPHTNNITVQYGGLIFGTGVDTQNVKQYSDQLMENRLMDQKSQMSLYEQSESYMKVLEGLLNEGTESSLSYMSSEFWNSWHDLADNPPGSSERIGVYQNGIRIAQGLNSINSQLSQIETDLSQDIESSVGEVNRLTKEIANINGQLVALEHDGTANDLRDKRNGLLSDLSKIVDINTFEQPSGGLIVTTANGFQLVNGPYTYGLKMEEGNVTWEGSYGGSVDLTDKITGGKMGGLLNLREEIIPKYRDEIDIYSKELMWQINYAQSGGAGTDYYGTDMEGVYEAGSDGLISTLSFGSRIDYNQDNTIWVRDTRNASTSYSPYETNMGISNASVTNWTGTGTIDAVDAPPYQYRFTVTTGGVVNDEANPYDPRITWEKLNTQGVVIKSDTIPINKGTITVDDDPLAIPPVAGISFDIGSGELVEGNVMTVNTDVNANSVPLGFAATGRAGSINDTYKFTVKNAGVNESDITGRIGYEPVTIEWQSTFSSGTFTITPQDPPYLPLYVDVDGMRMEFNGGSVVEGDVFTLATNEQGVPEINPVPGNLPTDWHWTMNSFRDQFNRDVKGVEAVVTSDMRFKLEPEIDGYEVDNIRSTGGINKDYTNIKYEDYSAFKDADTNIQLSRSAGGVWSLGGITSDKYLGAKIVPAPLDLAPVGPAGTINSTYTFTVATGGVIGTDPVTINWTNGTIGGVINLTAPLGAAPVIDGMTLNFNSGALYKDDVFTVETDALGAPTLASTPLDKGFGIDLSGDGGVDMMVSFDTPIETAGTYTFDIQADKGEYAFNFSDDKSGDSGIYAALGLNTFFQGDDSMTIEVNKLMATVSNIGASRVDAMDRTGITSDVKIAAPFTIAAGVNDQIVFHEATGAEVTATIKPSLAGGTYTTDADMDVLAADIEKALESVSLNRLDYKVSFDAESRKFRITEERSSNEIGFTLQWNKSSAREALGFNDQDDVYTPPTGVTEGAYGSADNQNALALSDLQNKTIDMARRTYIRGEVANSESVNASLDGFYQGMIGSLGTQSASISRSKDFNISMVQKLTETRDSLSGVSLDEEMVNLMKYQHAYSVAAKLLTTCDEMLTTLIAIK
ncbi:flagellar hook-associated protein FlgK [Desulforegula conservatrix]|uniref:flagellar hook-associated protein FlgK n=1 Tax=Desulforegula conservatrix TaxID=153026 RepID=UPI000429C05F|nr:flagellar hook-associated protein FlgK [Desulforegula conservatrix]